MKKYFFTFLPTHHLFCIQNIFHIAVYSMLCFRSFFNFLFPQKQKKNPFFLYLCIWYWICCNESPFNITQMCFQCAFYVHAREENKKIGSIRCRVSRSCDEKKFYTQTQQHRKKNDEIKNAKSKLL